MERMLGSMSDSQYKAMKEEMSELQLEDMYERMIHRMIKIDCEKALAMVNKKMNKNENIQYLLELKARILWYKRTYDKGIVNALGETFHSEGVFRFPMTYLVYGTSSHVKEGSESQLKIYRLGLEEAQKKEDKELLNEFKKRIEPLEEAQLRRLSKSKKKMKGKMEMEEGKQEAVKDIKEELENVVDDMAEHYVLKKKYEDDIFLDHGKQFTMISKLGKYCYMGIQDTGKVEVEKSLVAATKRQVEEFKVLHYICSQHQSLLTVESVVRHPTDGTDSLVCEVVHTLNDYFEKELQKLHGEEMTETQWWEHISEKFRRIFRDVIQGMMFLYLTTDYACGDLSFNIFVTKSGRGRILPSMVTRKVGTKETIDHINQLKDAMKTVIAFPFNGNTTNLELPLELRRFLDFKHSGCFSPPWFVINCPFFWTVEERVQFVHELKMLIKLNAKTKWTIEACLVNAGVFARWKSVPDGVYKKILYYHEPTTSNAEDESESAHVTSQAHIGYHDRVDICRFFVAAYSHLNDYSYKSDRRNKIFKRAEIEEALSTYFPYFYVNMFECLCLNADKLGDEVLKMVSSSADVSDFPRI